jgi:hypothetical protein
MKEIETWFPSYSGRLFVALIRKNFQIIVQIKHIPEYVFLNGFNSCEVVHRGLAGNFKKFPDDFPFRFS